MDSRRQAAEAICSRLREAGHRALLAGGCVRDMLLGVCPKDYDIATSARPKQVAQLFEQTVSVGAAFGVQVVILPEGQFEVATFRNDGPYLDGRRPSTVVFSDERKDASRRDFTVNALFYDPEEERIIDYVGGQHDIEAGFIRTVGDPKQRFEEDRLRLLRAVRFAARLGYTIADDTYQALCDMASLVTTPSAERIREEFLKILTEGGAKRGLEVLDDTGMLPALLPEIARMKGVAQPEAFHPEGDVFTHTLLMLDLAETPSPTLAMGVLLHDVGKPLTFTNTDRIRFNNHDKVGAEVAAQICKRLRLSTKQSDRVVWLVAQHMRLASAPDMRASKLKRFVREEGFTELVELCRLDCLASHRSLELVHWVQDYLAQLPPEQMRPEPFLTGQDLIEMGYAPGPLFASILRAVEDAQLENGLRTVEDAKRFVHEQWPVQDYGEP